MRLARNEPCPPSALGAKIQGRKSLGRTGLQVSSLSNRNACNIPTPGASLVYGLMTTSHPAPARPDRPCSSQKSNIRNAWGTLGIAQCGMRIQERQRGMAASRSKRAKQSQLWAGGPWDCGMWIADCGLKSNSSKQSQIPQAVPCETKPIGMGQAAARHTAGYAKQSQFVAPDRRCARHTLLLQPL